MPATLTETVRIELEATTCDEIRTLAESWDRSFDETLTTLISRGLRDATTMGVCRDCGCTEDDPCIGDGDEPCHWVGEDLCSECAW